MKLSSSKVLALTLPLGLLLGGVAPSINAAVVTNASGYIIEVSDLLIGGANYDVTFFNTTLSPSKVTSQSALWATTSDYQAAYAALLAEMNTVSTPFSYIVAATDGSGALNNDFVVGGPNSAYAHLRALQGGPWGLAANLTSPLSIMAEFTKTSTTAASPVSEPAGIALVGLAIGAAGLRQRQSWHRKVSSGVVGSH